MDDDTVFRRVNIITLDRAIKQRCTGSADTMAIARAMIRVLNRSISRSVTDFERGDGDFEACYLEALRSLDGK
ncbi:MAG: hypothetical protein AABZ39_03715 [Spirochaetota bacterium]